MSYSVVVSQSVQGGTTLVNGSKTYTENGRVALDENVANGETDKQINVSIDVSAVKAFILLSDQDITIETNNGSTPDDTINLKADVAYIWTEDSYDSFLLTSDVTALFVTNASGSTARLQMECLYDPTP